MYDKKKVIDLALAQVGYHETGKNIAGDIYVSTIDNNVWEPGVYGWEVVK